MTETCGGCVHDGLALPGVHVRVSDVGAIALSGPMLADGYRRRHRDEPLTVDGWFATHDVGEWSDGRLRVLGRDDDVVTSGGVSVPLPAVDALLAEHPDVADAVAVGLVPDAEWGSRVVAVVVPRPGAAPLRSTCGRSWPSAPSRPTCRATSCWSTTFDARRRARWTEPRSRRLVREA